MKTFPSDHGVFLLVADDIRDEGGGKLTILGLLGNEVVAKEPVGENSALPSLAVVYIFTDGEGEFTGSVQLTDPDGNDAFPVVQSQQMKKTASGYMQVAFKLIPFKLKLGVYRCCVMLDDKKYERSFKVSNAA